MEREDERLRRRHRLRRSDDFRRAYRKGRRRRGRLANLHYLPSSATDEGSEARLGITASRKVGNAVTRHSLKRRVREIFRRYPDRHHLSGLDLVIHLHPAAAEAGFDALHDEIVDQLRRVAATRR